MVDIITRKNINGFIVEAQHKTTEAGGGVEKCASVAYRVKGDRRYLTGSLDAYGREEITLAQRD